MRSICRARRQIALPYVCRALRLHSCLFAKPYQRASTSGKLTLHCHLFARRGDYYLFPEQWDCIAVSRALKLQLYVQEKQCDCSAIFAKHQDYVNINLQNNENYIATYLQTRKTASLPICKTLKLHCFLFAKQWDYVVIYLQNSEIAILFIWKTVKLQYYSVTK